MITFIFLNTNAPKGENIADIGGIQAGYWAYKNYVAQFGPEPMLPGMEKFTMEQIYFMSYAYSWCTNQTTSSLKGQLAYDVHSPAYYRVNGVVSDFPEFAKAFGCRVGIDPMAPASNKRCTVW